MLSFGWRVGGVAIVVGGSPTIRTFVLPYKRFATPCLLARAKSYLASSRVTYRETVRHDRRLIGYSVKAPVTCTDESCVPEQPVVDHSLIWRMIGWLGGLALALDEARAMILQQNADSICHRFEGGVDPHKTRSPQRLTTLETARQLLQIIPEWEACFGCRFFPQFATRSGFP